MKSTYVKLIIGMLAVSIVNSLYAGSIKIVPVPLSVSEGKGSFKIESSTLIFVDETNGTSETANLLAEKIFLSTGLNFEIKSFNPAFPKKNCIVFTTLGADGSLGKEGYTINVSESDIYVKAVSANGFFYGLQTLLQLFPAEIEKQKSGLQSIAIPVVSIKDKPRFSYRGMHLDVGRHFYPVEFIKKYIDLMAMYKINTFHWHLTDDQGWRIEIKKYPGLTRIGSIRKGTQIGTSNLSDTIPYGGFYTQSQAREIVKYAASKYIIVIPEIEMPGHCIAALTAYPSLSCTGGPFEVRTRWGVSEDILCAGNDSAFTFMQDVLAEVLDIFPSTYIHIGGDEAPKGRWEKCEKCQARIKAENLKNESELQSYFINRIEKFLASKNRKLIGWDEILEEGISQDATVMAWRGIQPGIDAAVSGHNTIMTPVDYCYFDYHQGDLANEPYQIGSLISLKTVYSFNPVPPVLTPEQATYIIGVQGNVWTEYMKTTGDVEIKVFPRALAMAEIAWSAQNNRNWDDFQSRMDNQYPRLEYNGVKYSKGSFSVDISTKRENNKNLVVLSTENKGLDIYYTIDGSEPGPASMLYRTPFELNAAAIVKAVTVSNKVVKGGSCQKEILKNQASGKPVTILKPYSFKYPATGDQAMTDGLTGANSYKSGWQGYEGSDVEFMVDLLQPTQIHTAKISFVKNPADWVLSPEMVQFAFSNDGKTWIEKEPINLDASSPSIREIKTAVNTCEPATAYRYIKVMAKSPKVLPGWHEYKGKPCWIFCDELVVE